MDRPHLRPTKKRKIFFLVVFCTLVHILLLKAVFDIYFSRPIDHGMTPIRSTANPPSKRVVFISADGLRAEQIFGKGLSKKTTHLTKIRKTRASWGTVHTGVPTESHPGHLALLAGIYEDPAAIILGWTGNSVKFDSVINESSNAWCWGSPNVVHMFNTDNLPHIHSYSYNASVQDFGKNNTVALDLWVFERVEAFIREKTNCLYCPDFYQSGNIFFLHLLGIDTAGHRHNLKSHYYLNNVKVVDSLIPQIEQLFETAFPDKTTTYIFTSDHGMTNRGSHGSGSTYKREVPFIAWGAGIKVSESPSDIRQIDIAPLVSALIGINYPINSIGILPLDLLDTSEENKGQMLIANIRQLTEIYNSRQHRRKSNSDLTPQMIKAKMLQLRQLLAKKEFLKLKRESMNFMEFLLKGADYYHNYYQIPILISVTIGFAAFIIYIATYNIPIKRDIIPKNVILFIEIFLFIPTYFNLLFLLQIQKLPLMYYIYFVFPIVMAQILVHQYSHILEAMRQIRRYGFRSAAINFFVYIGGLRLLVQSLHERKALCILVSIMAFVVFFSRPYRRNTNLEQKFVWICWCGFVLGFLLLPSLETLFGIYIYILGIGFWWMVTHTFEIRLLANSLYDFDSLKVIFIQSMMLKVTPLYTLIVASGNVSPDSYWKYLAWIWAFYPILTIPSTNFYVFIRLISIYVGFAPFYLMVSTNCEILFLTIFTLLLFTWLVIESKCLGYYSIYHLHYYDQVILHRTQTADDFRRAFFFIVFIFVGFFGIGNVASVSSFDPLWVRCFFTVFSPVTMTGLIVLKVAIPLMYTVCTFRAINIFGRISTLNTFCLILVFADLMLIKLMFSITNTGTFFEIASNLSHFILMELFVLILLILYGMGCYLTTTTYTNN